MVEVALDSEERLTDDDVDGDDVDFVSSQRQVTQEIPAGSTRGCMLPVPAPWA